MFAYLQGGDRPQLRVRAVQETVMRATHIPVPSDHGHPSDGDHHHEEDFRLAYRRDLLLVDRGVGQGAFTPPDDAEELDAQQLAEALWAKDKSVAAGIGTTAEHLSRLLQGGRIAAYRVIRSRDPLELVQQFNERNDSARASLVLVTTITGHWTYAPGTPPTGTTLSTAAITDAVDQDKFVAVIDTGYSENSDFPDWLTARAQALEPIDAEPQGLPGPVRGHGAFVASLIAQLAQDTNIRVARVRNVSPSDVGTDGPKSADEKIRNGYGSDELQLYVAVSRLLSVINPETGQPYTWQALNLSLGSYTDDETSGLAIKAAMQLWNEGTNGAPVFAAAGNHEVGETTTERFIPAAYEPDFNICAIASCDADTGLSDFSNDAPTRALGRRLVGIRHDGNCWEWSGSSFATAVATASFLKGGQVPTGTTVPTPSQLPHTP